MYNRYDTGNEGVVSDDGYTYGVDYVIVFYAGCFDPWAANDSTLDTLDEWGYYMPNECNQIFWLRKD